MKKIILLSTGFAMLAGALLQSCNKTSRSAVAKVTVESIDLPLTIPKILNKDTVQSFGDIMATTNIDSIIKAKNSTLSTDDIRSATITSMSIELTNADSANSFANFENMTVNLLSGNVSTPVLISTQTTIPDVIKTKMDMPVDNSFELRTYMATTLFKYSFRGKPRRTTSKALTALVKVTYNIQCGI